MMKKLAILCLLLCFIGCLIGCTPAQTGTTIDINKIMKGIPDRPLIGAWKSLSNDADMFMIFHEDGTNETLYFMDTSSPVKKDAPETTYLVRSFAPFSETDGAVTTVKYLSDRTLYNWDDQKIMTEFEEIDNSTSSSSSQTDEMHFSKDGNTLYIDSNPVCKRVLVDSEEAKELQSIYKLVNQESGRQAKRKQNGFPFFDYKTASHGDLENNLVGAWKQENTSDNEYSYLVFSNQSEYLILSHYEDSPLNSIETGRYFFMDDNEILKVPQYIEQFSYKDTIIKLNNYFLDTLEGQTEEEQLQALSEISNFNDLCGFSSGFTSGYGLLDYGYFGYYGNLYYQIDDDGLKISSGKIDRFVNSWGNVYDYAELDEDFQPFMEWQEQNK